MADKQEQVTVVGKPAWLQEVEDDAVYLTNKRFAEAKAEEEREEEKAARNAERTGK